jgi:hypothetical protein
MLSDGREGLSLLEDAWPAIVSLWSGSGEA